MEIQKPNKKILIAIFATISLFFVLSNPLLQPLNIYGSSESLSANKSTLSDGLSLQGSFIVQQNTDIVQATNSSNGQTVNAYQISTAYLNMGSICLLFIPFIIYFYYSNEELKRKVKK